MKSIFFFSKQWKIKNWVNSLVAQNKSGFIYKNVHTKKPFVFEVKLYTKLK